jgi:hypothetical protein
VTADGAMSTMAGLAPYSGPGGRCPKCQVPYASGTEWHWATVAFASQVQRGRAPACGELGLLGMPVEGEHLCRLCTNCGYGWAEACAVPAGTPRGATVPAAAPAPPGPGVPPLAVLLFCLAASLAGTGAGWFLSLQVSGAALAAAWLAAAAAITTVIAAAARRTRKGSSR